MRNKKLSTIGLVLTILLLITAGVVYVIKFDVMPYRESKDKVAVTIFPLFDIVRNIAGDKVEPVLVLKTGGSPHTFSPTAENMKELSGATLAFAIGHGVDDWMFDLVESVDVKKVVVVDRNIKLVVSDEEEYGNHAENEDRAGEASPDGEGENPHYWLSIPNAILIAQQVADELTAVFPESAEYFNDNLLSYRQKLVQNDQLIQSEIDQLETKKIAVFHDAWVYFAQKYGLDIAATFEEFPGKEPSPQYLADFTKTVMDQNITAIFYEPQFSASALEPIARDLGVNLWILDPIGGMEGRLNYIDLMQFNANQIVLALTGEKQ